MLQNYFFDNNGLKQPDEVKREKAVAAALEIARASAGATTQRSASDKVDDDLKYAARSVAVLADAIEAALLK